MAKQESINKFIGTMDGINYYRRNGKYLARKAGGGFSTEGFKNNPKMEGVRRRSTDFGHCSKVNKHFKEALQPVLQYVNDGTLHSRMMKLFLTILKNDTLHEKGAKQIATAMAKPDSLKQLRDFCYTPLSNPLSILGTKSIEVDMDSSKAVIADWYLSDKVFPKGTRMLGFQLNRLHFDFKTLNYELAEGDHELFAMGDTARPFELSAHKPKLEGEAFMVLSVQFFVNELEEDLYESIGTRGAGFCLL